MRPYDMPFIPGRDEPLTGPLARYLPPVPEGMARAWLEQSTSPGDWVLDPFGSSPLLAIEAARCGGRVLAAVNNPVTRFVLEVLAAAPSAADFQGALADLASARRGDERLERSIRSMYASECAACGRSVEVHAFLWERGAVAPSARIYTCESCGDSGERPVSPRDMERISAYSAGGLHRARALERVAALGDPVREDVQDALECYISRPLVALFNLINRVEGLALPPARKALLMALLLSACDMASALWPHPAARTRPRQLSVPPRFREINLWLALEDAISDWTVNSKPVALCHWPEQPPESGGIAIFQGRLKDLASSLPDLKVKAILTAIPRPAQAYWTLSALWSGWLWGREAVQPLKSVLSRRRYDWNWHTAALEAAMGNLPERLPVGSPFFAIFAELEPGLLGAGMLAARRSGFTLEGMAVRPEDGLAQVLWRSGPTSRSTPLASANPERSAIYDLLVRRAEPTAYVTTFAAACAALLEAQPPQIARSVPAADALAYVQTHLRQVFSDRGFLARFGGGEHTPESGMWWFVNPPQMGLSLADRVEMDVVRTLQKEASSRPAELDRSLCTAYPGLLTPPPGLVRACLESYAQEDPAAEGIWRLRAQDQPATRRSDLKEAGELLNRLGKAMGFQVEGESPLIWLDADGSPAYVYYLLASAVIGRFILDNTYPAEKCVAVLPGSRSNLVAVKLRLNPLLQKQVSAGWRFLKFRQLRSLADNPLMDREQWSMQLGSDPPEFSASQLSLF
ncbi:MAG TPA: hypothetical protein VGJ97_08650 [Anaerolineaceae bacterium]